MPTITIAAVHDFITNKTKERAMNATRPTIGQTYNVRGILCRIYAIYPAGTIDVQEIGGDERCWRVTGLPFV